MQEMNLNSGFSLFTLKCCVPPPPPLCMYDRLLLLAGTNFSVLVLLYLASIKFSVFKRLVMFFLLITKKSNGEQILAGT